MKSLISVVINTRNEEKYLPRVLASVKGLADEVVVVDMESSDKSVEAAKRLGARIFRHKFIDYVEPARNFGVSKAKGDWILVLDPDEEVSPTLARRLRDIATEAKEEKIDYVRIPRKNIIFGKWIKGSRWWPDYKIRFFKKGSVSWSGVIHDEPRVIGGGKDLEAVEDFVITHYHYDNIEKYILWSNRYADIRSSSLNSSGYRFQWSDLIRKPFGEFLSRYFYGEGYKDGIHGLALAILQGCAEFLVYAKVWEKQGFFDKDIGLLAVEREMKEAGRESNYWLADSLFKAERNPIKKLQQRVIRKLSS